MKRKIVSLLGIASLGLPLFAMPENQPDLLSSTGVSTVMQQQKAVQGKVLDQTGSPIIGASVLVKGTTRGTITDVDGNFSIDVAKGETLVISYIGYVNQEIVPTGKNLSIVLKEDNEVLDEVVVLGYGCLLYTSDAADE